MSIPAAAEAAKNTPSIPALVATSVHGLITILYSANPKADIDNIIILGNRIKNAGTARAIAARVINTT